MKGREGKGEEDNGRERRKEVNHRHEGHAPTAPLLPLASP
jgi:hypothetical protein